MFKWLTVIRNLSKEESYIEKQEQQILEQYCMNSKKTNHIGIVICLYTGLRIGELLALTWDDIDFENGILNIDKEAYKVKENGIWRTIIDNKIFNSYYSYS